MPTMNEPVKLSDLVETAPIPSVEITPEERDQFVRAVEAEMKRLRFDEANEATAASERLTEHDFSVLINVH